MYSQNEVPRINVIDKDTKTDSHTIQNCSQKKSIYYLLMAIFITLIIITVIGVVWRFAKNYFSLESKPDTDTPKIGCKNTKNRMSEYTSLTNCSIKSTVSTAPTAITTKTTLRTSTGTVPSNQIFILS